MRSSFVASRHILNTANRASRKAAIRAPVLLASSKKTPFSFSFSSSCCACSSSSSFPSPQQQQPQQQQQQHQQEENYYTFFPRTFPRGPPPTGEFAVDQASLRREFLALQSRAHPDLAAPAGRRDAQTLSARINEAYRVLSSPLARAQYLLRLAGREGAHEDDPPSPSPSPAAGKAADDPELLMSVLDAHHEIEGAGSEEELEAVRKENEARIAQSVEAIGGFFGVIGDARRAGASAVVGGGMKGEEEKEEEETWNKLREETVRLKYWVAIREKIHEWEVGKGKDV